MDIIRAIEILKCLSENLDPFTGELLPEDSICNHAEVVRAFYRILFELSKQPDLEQMIAQAPRQLPNPKKPRPENTGKPWTKEDDEALAQMFDNGCSKQEMEWHFQRTAGGIAARLVRLGKIQDRYSF